MSYHFSKTVDGDFDQVIAKVTDTLGAHGFGVLTKIDVQATLKKKIGADFRPYTILGACNPNFAFKALQMEDKLGTMLPCNVIVQQKDDGKIEVSAVDPIASMEAIDNPPLAKVTAQVRGLLKGAIESL
jgi:uncharacterized protein (DUF302 family)